MNNLFDTLHLFVDTLRLIGSFILIVLMAILLYMVGSIVFPPTVKIIPHDPSQVITHGEMQLFFGEV